MDSQKQNINLSQLALFCAGVLTTNLLVGCRSPAYVKSDTAAWNLQTAASEVRANSRNLDATTAALNEIVNNPASDLRIQYKQFSTALDQLIASSKETSGMAARLEKKKAAYLEAWDKELAAMKDDEIRKSSEARKSEVSNEFDTTNQHQQQAQNSLMPVVGYFVDVRRALTADLTTAGLQAAKPATVEATARKEKVQAELGQTANDLDALGVRMSSYMIRSGQTAAPAK